MKMDDKESPDHKRTSGRKEIMPELDDEEILKCILIRKNGIAAVIKNKEAALRSAPKGNLKIADRKKYCEYYLCEGLQKDGIKYIPKDKQGIAKKIIQRDYDRKVLKMAKEEFDLLSDYSCFLEDHQITRLYDALSAPRRNQVVPIRISDEDYVASWMQEKYEPMGFGSDAPEYYSDSGIRVRSKSELIIVDQLEKAGVPFKYERPPKLDRYGTVRPDFTCLNVRARKEYIWEHFGMMDEPDYADKNVAKINAYEANGYHAGESLIMSFETSQNPIKPAVIKSMIENYLI